MLDVKDFDGQSPAIVAVLFWMTLPLRRLLTNFFSRGCGRPRYIEPVLGGSVRRFLVSLTGRLGWLRGIGGFLAWHVGDLCGEKSEGRIACRKR